MQIDQTAAEMRACVVNGLTSNVHESKFKKKDVNASSR
jgi:hypothetical protein